MHLSRLESCTCHGGRACGAWTKDKGVSSGEPLLLASALTSPAPASAAWCSEATSRASHPPYTPALVAPPSLLTLPVELAQSRRWSSTSLAHPLQSRACAARCCPRGQLGAAQERRRPRRAPFQSPPGPEAGRRLAPLRSFSASLLPRFLPRRAHLRVPTLAAHVELNCARCSPCTATAHTRSPPSPRAPSRSPPCSTTSRRARRHRPTRSSTAARAARTTTRSSWRSSASCRGGLRPQ